jgi:hypothetical protein
MGGTAMNKASRIALIRILGPLAARQMRPVEEASAFGAGQQAVALQSFAAAFAVRDQLKQLEDEMLIVMAQSHAVSRRARAVRPLINAPLSAG